MLLQKFPQSFSEFASIPPVIPARLEEALVLMIGLWNITKLFLNEWMYKLIFL